MCLYSFEIEPHWDNRLMSWIGIDCLYGDYMSGNVRLL